MTYFELHTGIWNPREKEWSLIPRRAFNSRIEATQAAKEFTHAPWRIVECRVVASKNPPDQDPHNEG